MAQRHERRVKSCVMFFLSFLLTKNNASSIRNVSRQSAASNLDRLSFCAPSCHYRDELVISARALDSQMKNLRSSFAALVVSFIVAFAGSKVRASIHRQRNGRTYARPRHFYKLETVSTESTKQTSLGDKHNLDWHHSSMLPKPTMNCNPVAPIVSFTLNKNGVSGGFGDRMMGMVTTYYLAMMTNSSFEVQWTQPYNLSEYFAVPSCHALLELNRNDAEDGSHPNNEIITRRAIDIWDYFTDSSFLDDTGKNLEVTTNSFHWRDVVRNEAFRDRAASLGLADMSQAELFKLAVDDLLGNPTKIVADSFTSVLRRLAGGYEPNDFGPSYVGVQIRLGGGAVSGWQDPSRHSMDDVQCFAKEAVRLCRLMHIRSVFVTADSDEAVRAFEGGVLRESEAADLPSSSAPIIVQIPGVIAHTDRSNIPYGHSKDVWLKSILDWWVLKHASALVVSRSGFGETAAMASDAEAALRLRLSPPGEELRSTKENSNRCEFEDLLLSDKDVMRNPG